MSAPAPVPAELIARYRAIIDHAELELELAGRADMAGLELLGEHWRHLVDGLPAQPPAEAAPLLQRALLLHERTRIELARLNETLLGQIENTRVVRRTADGYAGQLVERPRLDRSA